MAAPSLVHAAQLWHYLSNGRHHEPADVIVVCCSYDLRVCDYACELFKSGLGQKLIFSGNTGNWTRHLWDRPEAHVYRERALERGIKPDAMLIEDQATNFGENVRFSRNLAPSAHRVIFLTKPNSVLRVRLTIPLQWPEITAFVDSPRLSFPDDVSHMVGVLGVIDEMVGDVQRIQQYPAKGFQVAHDLPPTILESWNFLISQGFRNHLQAPE
jgi:uncharacterized SAM-binding protein YcdF (DUF218 family)